MAHSIDVTANVEFGNPDDEYLPLTRCVCGAEFEPWTNIISVYGDPALIQSCPKCGRRLYFLQSITVYELVNGADADDALFH